MKQAETRIDWLARCRIDNCSEQRVKCPVCKKYGHVVAHAIQPNKHSNLHYAQVAIQHSHFVEQQDAGRNIFCYPQYKEPLTVRETEVSIRISKKGRDRIKDKYSEKWKR